LADAFISYVEEDSALAEELARGLNDAGISAWRYEADAVSGQNYLLQTRSEIEQCGAFVVILSRSSIGSEQVDREVVRAHECGRPFLPVLGGLTYAEFSRRRPGWQQAMGAATALTVPEEGADGIIDRLVRGVREAAGLSAGGGQRKRVAPSIVQQMLRRLRSRRLWRTALILTAILAAASFGAYAYLQKRAADARSESAHNKAEAVSLLNTGRAADALPKLERAIALTPNDSELYLHRGRALYEMRQEAKALPDLDRRLWAKPQDPEALLYRGLVNSVLHNSDQALADVSAAIGSRSLSQNQYTDACFERAMLLIQRGAPQNFLRIMLTPGQRADLANAEADLSEVIQIRGWPFDLLERGRVRMWLGKPSEARGDLLEAYNRTSRGTRQDDKFIANDAMLLTGVIDLLNGDFSQAQLGFDAALQHDPGNPKAMLCRALARIGAGHVEEGVGAIEKLVSQMPESDPLRPAVVQSLEDSKKYLAGLPVQALGVSVEPYVEGDAGTGVLFHIRCRINGKRGENLFGDLFVYESNGSPYEHDWLRVPARDKAYSTPSGHLAASARFTPTKDDASVDDLRIFLPYEQTPRYNGPQRYVYVLRLVDQTGKAISTVLVGEFSFTYPYPPK
jgi:tetratricopeptide (TPR) repeat protein